jgi:hypothetical protein
MPVADAVGDLCQRCVGLVQEGGGAYARRVRVT